MVKKMPSLSDLYVQSTTVPFEVAGETYEVVLVKLNTPETDNAVRRANAAKAAILVDAQNPESDRYMAALGRAIEMDDEQLAMWSVLDELGELEVSTQHRIASEEPWSTDGYLDTLVAGWDDLRTAFEDGPEVDDPTRFEEAVKVKDELERFGSQVEEEFTAARDDLVAVQASLGRPVLQDLVVKQVLRLEAEECVLRELRFQRLFAATRNPGTGPPRRLTRHFESVLEVKECEPEVLLKLLKAYEAMIVDGTEGKDLPAQPDSSPPSESPADTDPEQDSGLSEPID